MGIQINGQTDTVTATDGSINVGGDVTIPGVLTYEDVTSVDSVGLSTFQNGIHVTGGSVGIGTDNPQEDLHIGGNSPYILLDDYDNFRKWRLKGTAWFAIEDTTAGEDRLRILSNGNIGIGTDNPIRRLHVQSPGSTSNALFGNSENNNSIEVTRTGSTASYFQVQTYTNICNIVGGPTLTFRTSDPIGSASTERLRITSSGNVGIGTDNPYARNHIEINAAAGAGSGSAGALWLKNANQTANNSATIFFGNNLNQASGAINLIHKDYSTDAGDITFDTRENGSTYAERLRITSDGRLLVGDTDPTGSEKIYCKGSDSSASGLYIHNSNGATNSSADLWFGNWSGATTAVPQARISALNKNVNTAATDLLFYLYDGNNTLERLRITSAGKLTITPADTTSSYATTDGGIDIAQTISSTGTSSSQSIGIQFSLTKSGQTGAIAEIGAIREGSGLSGLVFRTRDNSTGRNERLRIDSSGHITAPYQPCFSAYRSTSQSFNVSDTVVFNVEIFDNNGDYSTSTGNFTAPVTGRYLFLATVLVQGISQGDQFDIRLSTSNRNYYGAPGRSESQLGTTWGNDYIALGVQQIADMDVGDTAHIDFSSFDGGSIYGNTGGNLWTRFSAYLLC